jgi:steroid delta-isomerase-like uncharacterized protein
MQRLDKGAAVAAMSVGDPRPHHNSVRDVLGEPVTASERSAILGVLDAFYHAHNTHSPALAGALYASEGVHREVADRRERNGREEIQRGLETFLTAFPDARWEPCTCTLAPGRAAVSYVLTGSLRCALGEISPTGQRLELEGVHVFWIGGLGIEQVKDYWDAGTFISQMRKSPS